MKRVCEYCNNEFESRPKKFFCSKTCSKKYHTIKKSCSICGKEFETDSRYNKKSCSISCAKILHNSTKRKYQEKTCLNCKDKFFTSSKNQNCCSLKCSMEYKKKTAFLNLKEITCDTCGKSFLYDKRYKNEYGRKFCSKKCRIRSKNELITSMIYRSKHRAIDKNIPFNLQKEDIIIPDKCPILGIDLIVGENYLNDNSPSLDRIIPEKGYVKDNIAVISNRANMIKSVGTAEEHRLIADWIEKFINNDQE